ncbi:MAG: polyamine ABC transporter substrate-binding protein [Desulfurivibrionaceae bacterium]
METYKFRQTICRHTSFLISAFILVFTTAGITAAADLTIVSWGGDYTRSQMLAYVLPYAEEKGVEVEVLDYSGGLEEIRSQVSSMNIKWDVVDLELTDALRGCREGLLERIEPDILNPAPDGSPAAEDFIEGSLRECAVGSVVWSTVIAHNSEAYPEKQPESLEDFFDIKSFPGGRGMRKTPKANLEWALIADGVPPEKVYDELETQQGLDRAFKMLNRIKPCIKWWEEGEEAPQMLADGEVSMSTAYSGRIYRAAEQEDKPLEIIWDRQIWNIDLWAIPKGSRHKEAALDFIRFATAPDRMAAQSRHIPYGPVRASALKQVPEKIRKHLPTEQHNFSSALQIDAGWWSENYYRVNQQFQRWLERSVQVPRSLPR